MLEYELLKRDTLKLYLLNEAVNENSTSVILYLESDGAERNLLSIRKSDFNIYQFNNFAVTELAAENSISFKPNVVGCPAYIKVNSGKDLVVEIIRNGSTEVEQRIELFAGEIKLEFAPENYSKYRLYINQLSTAFDENTIRDMAQEAQKELHTISGDSEKLLKDISIINNAIEDAKDKKAELLGKKSALDAENAQLSENVNKLNGDITRIEEDRKKLVDDKAEYTVKLEKIKAEYEKDYDSYKDDIEELKRNYDIDAEILKYYEDKDVTPIEELINKAMRDIEQIEEQIRLFADAKARKTAEIESELKLGKKE